MKGFKHGYCFNAWCTLLIIFSLLSLTFAFINLNNLTNTSVFLQLNSFFYGGPIGIPESYCFDEGFLGFCWLCGLLNVTALVAGLMGLGVKERINCYNLFFLFISGFTAFITSIIVVVCSCMVLQCHVTLTGKLPVPTLLIAIFGTLIFFLSLFAFLKVLNKRWEMASDLKYGIEPLPDPFELTVKPENIQIVGGANRGPPAANMSGPNGEFYRAIGQPGGRFEGSYARSNLLANPNRFQMPPSTPDNANRHNGNNYYKGNRENASRDLNDLNRNVENGLNDYANRARSHFYQNSAFQNTVPTEETGGY